MITFGPDFYAICRLHGVREPAYQDVLAQFDDSVESLTEFLQRMKPERPHWFAEVVTDPSGNEPAVYNIDAQAAYTREHSPDATRELLARHGLKLGQVKAAPKEDAANIKGANNPYDRTAFRGTEAERQKRIASLIASGGTKLAAALSKSAGCKIDGTPLNKR